MRPWAKMLNVTVHTTVIASTPPPSTPLFNTMIANTMLASPRGPNQPRNSLLVVDSPVPVKETNIGSMRTIVRLSSEYTTTCQLK